MLLSHEAVASQCSLTEMAADEIALLCPFRDNVHLLLRKSYNFAKKSVPDDTNRDVFGNQFSDKIVFPL